MSETYDRAMSMGVPRNRTEREHMAPVVERAAETLTAAQWAERLNDEIGDDYDAWSEAFAAGSAGGVGVTGEHPDYRDDARQFASADGHWFATLGHDHVWHIGWGDAR